MAGSGGARHDLVVGLKLNWIDVDWVNAACTLAIAAVAGIYALIGIRRDRRGVWAEIHRDLTTGEVALARDVVGTVIYSGWRARHLPKVELMRALFVLYWGVERADNASNIYKKSARRKAVARRLRATSRRKNLTRSESVDLEWQKRKSEFLTWNLEEIVGNILEFRMKYRDSLDLVDGDAWQSFVSRLQANQYLLFLKYEDKIRQQLTDDELNLCDPRLALGRRIP